MTDTAFKIVAALIAALTCVAGGLFVYFTLGRPLPPPPDTPPTQLEVQFDNLADVDGALPPDVVDALVWADPTVATKPAPTSRSSTGPKPGTEPEPSTEPTPPSNAADETTSPAPDPPAAGSGEQEQQEVPESAQRPTPPDPAAAAPAPPPGPQSFGRVTRIDDRTQLTVELNRLQAYRTVTTHTKDGVWLAVATPRTGYPTTAAAALGGITALTGAVAALVIVLLWPARRPGPAGAPPPDDPRHPSDWPIPDPYPATARHAALAGAGGHPAVGPPPAVPPPPPPDPQVPALLTQRATLVRGLADLAAKLPAEFDWQAANVLDAAGMRRFVPDGATFDPAVHHVVDTQPTPDAQLDDTVARTLRPGWEDRGQVMVPARVVLYALPDGPSSGPDDAER